MASYTDADKIAKHLGVALTPEQQTQADVVAEAITVWIDHRTGRTWQNATGTVTDEIQPVNGGVVYLAYPPVSAVSSVETRPRGGGGSQPWVVLAPADYLLADPSAGRLEIPGASNNTDARVDYTTSGTAPPADLAYAATVLSADVLFTMLHPESAGVEQLSVAQNDISVRYAQGERAGHSSGTDLAVRIVDAYRKVVLA